jgi:hypothetical protein
VVDIIEEGSNIILKATAYELKIDSNRIIYIKPKTSTIFKNINHEIPYGFDKDTKKRFLVELYKRIEYRLKQEEEYQELEEQEQK